MAVRKAQDRSDLLTLVEVYAQQWKFSDGYGDDGDDDYPNYVDSTYHT